MYFVQHIILWSHQYLDFKLLFTPNPNQRSPNSSRYYLHKSHKQQINFILKKKATYIKKNPYQTRYLSEV
jgi:hypothetical protein